jgi:hypothetical protein
VGGGKRNCVGRNLPGHHSIYNQHTSVSRVQRGPHAAAFSPQTPNLSYFTAGHTANPFGCSRCHTINAPDIYHQSPSGGFQSRQIRTSPYVRHLLNERPIHTFPHDPPPPAVSSHSIVSMKSDVAVIKAPRFNFPAENATQQFN